jgi:glyoxylase-like metal-dependent hydrolase (beta-lactamase superfamily II)
MPQQRVGEATVDKVFELDGLVMPVSTMFPSVTDADLETAAPWLFDPYITGQVATSRVNFSWHAYVVRFGDKTVVVDTGHGNDKRRPDFIPPDSLRTDFLGKLREAGVDPDSVTHVLCSHMHYDHVGWNTRLVDSEWVPSFPHARYVFPRADFDELSVTHATDVTNGPAFEESVAPLAERGLVDLVDDGDVVLDTGSVRIRVEGAAGHSPGSSLYHLESGSEHAIFVGDVIHHPFQFAREDIALTYELELDKSIAVRAKLLAAVADKAITLFPAHFGHTSGGHVLRDPATGAYAWQFLPSD